MAQSHHPGSGDLRGRRPDSLRPAAGAAAAALLGLVGCGLLLLGDAREPGGAATVGEVMTGLPLAASLTAGVLVASWPLVRRPVAPAGLFRGPRILSPVGALIVALLCVTCAVPIGQGNVAAGFAASVLLGLTVAGFVAASVRARPAAAEVVDGGSGNAYLLRTPGMGAIGLGASVGTAVLGVTSADSMNAVVWTVTPLVVALYVAYLTALAVLVARGSVAAIVALCLGVGMVVWAASDQLRSSARDAAPLPQLAAAAALTMVFMAVEAARRRAVAA